MNKYPFFYFDNTEKNKKIENDKKEIFMWFHGNLSGKERKFVRECLFSLVSDHFVWGDLFLFFKCINDINDLAGVFDRINEIVPVAFVIGPSVLDPEGEWNEYSLTGIDEVIDMFLKFVDHNFWIINGEGKRKTKRILSFSEEHLRIFRYKFKEISGMAADMKRTLHPDQYDRYVRLADLQYETDGIKGPFDFELSTETMEILKNASVVDFLLKGLAGERRLLMINRLKPYTRLSYYASYTAMKNRDLFLNENIINELSGILKELPYCRQSSASSYLGMIAYNIIRRAPEFIIDYTTYSKLAYKINKLTSSHINPDRGNGTGCHEPSEEYETRIFYGRK